MPVNIIECDFSNLDHRMSFITLLNAYIKDDMGGGEIIRGRRREKILGDLGRHPAKLIFFARRERAYVGMAVCFWGYSTFRAAPLVNIHDIIVLPAYRQEGVGRRLVEAVEAKACSAGCGKITLEVRCDNIIARKLYASMGYGECQPSMSFWTKSLKGQT